jgi:hypothetical protein
VYALIHTEYPGNVYGNCSGPAYPHCWTVTIGLGVSHDGGASWRHARPPPGHLVAAVPYGYNQSQLAYGWGDPSNIVRAPDGFFYAAIWNRNQVGLQAPGVCVMRTADVTDPAAWRAWGGAGWNVSWVSPYTMAPGTEAEHVCATVVTTEQCMPSGVVWSTYLSLFVITLDCINRQSALYMATSPDLVHWSNVTAFYSMADLPADVRRNVTSMTYPTFIDPTAQVDGNFGAIGQDPPLFWVSIGHSPYTDGRRVWATPFHFSA